MLLLRPLLSAAVFLTCAVPSLAGPQLSRFGIRSASDHSEVGIAKRADHFAPTPVARHEDVSARWMTNAERLARNLPLNPPGRRDPSKSLAARLAPSACPQVTRTGRLKVTDANGNGVGYVRDSYIFYGLLGATPNLAEALEVSVTYDLVQTNGPAVVKMINPPQSALPFFAAITSTFDSGSNLGQGSSNFVHLGGMANPGTPRGSAGSTDVLNSIKYATGSPQVGQSDIWTYNSVDNRLSLVWINTNQQSVPLEIYYEKDNKAFVGLADVQAFKNAQGDHWTGPMHLVLELVTQVQ